MQYETVPEVEIRIYLKRNPVSSKIHLYFYICLVKDSMHEITILVSNKMYHLKELLKL